MPSELSRYRCADKILARPGRKQATTTEDFDVQYILFIIIIGEILVEKVKVFHNRPR
jgi:hypothetical protein